MSGAVDKLDLGGGLNELGAQVTRVKSQKTSKLSLLEKAIRRFEEDPPNIVVRRDVQVCKDKSDDSCEAYGMLLEAII